MRTNRPDVGGHLCLRRLGLALLVTGLIIRPGGQSRAAQRPPAVLHGTRKEPTWQQLTDRGIDAYEAGRFADAERYLQAALRQAEGFGPRDPRRGDSYRNLASLYTAEHKLAAAERLFHRALAIYRRPWGRSTWTWHGR